VRLSGIIWAPGNWRESHAGPPWKKLLARGLARPNNPLFSFRIEEWHRPIAISGGVRPQKVPAANGARRDGETISAAYLWGLRTGVKDNPTMKHLQALARFFQVSPAYFFEEELTEFPETEVRLLAASRRETLRRLAVTLLGLSDESLDAVLNLACRMRYLEGLPVE